MPGKQDLGFGKSVNMLAKAVHGLYQFTETITGFTKSTSYEGNLAVHPILGSKKTRIGVTADTTLSDSGSVFVTEVEDISDISADGDYWLDHSTGRYKVKAGATASAVLTYYVEASVVRIAGATGVMLDPTFLNIAGLRVIAESEVTVTTAGTPVACPTNTSAKAVRVINNNVDGTIVAVGLAASVDAASTPPIGIVLTAYSSCIMYVSANSNEIYIDSSSSGKKATAQVLGV